MNFTQDDYQDLSEFQWLCPYELTSFFVGSKPGVYGNLCDDVEVAQLEQICNKFGVAFTTYEPSVDKENLEYRVGIAETPTEAEKIKTAEQNGDWFGMSNLLGYPDCCTNTYIECNKPDATMATQTMSTETFPFYTNRFLRMNKNRTLLSHFTCSYDCHESISMAKDRLDIIRAYDTEAATAIETQLTSVVVCVNDTGVVYTSDYTRDGDCISHNGFQSTRHETEESLLARMNQTDTFTINSPRSLTVDGITIEGDNIAVIVFIDPDPPQTQIRNQEP